MEHQIEKLKIVTLVQNFQLNKSKIKQRGNSLSAYINKNRQNLREWETSGDISIIYRMINKNRKMIKEKLKDKHYLLTGNYNELVQTNNLIEVLKEVLPKYRLSNTQWKMIAGVAKSENIEGLINITNFFRLMEITAKNLVSHVVIKTGLKGKDIKDYSGWNSNSIGFKTMTNGFYYDRRRNSVNKDIKGFYNLSNYLNNSGIINNSGYRRRENLTKIG